MMDTRTVYPFLIWILSSTAQNWKMNCNICLCQRVNDKKTADCSARGFNIIPDDLSADIRHIDFSNNNFRSLEGEVFSEAHLTKVHKLKLQNCSIQEMNKLAFSKLLNLTELNLGSNNIEMLDKDMFKENARLTTLILNNNKIKVLEDGLFYNLTLLQKILLDHNEIVTISKQTFQALPALVHISLTYNKIQRITFDMKQHLPNLTSLSVEGNPWICDCLLREFGNSAQQNNLITTSSTCQSPPRLHGHSLLDDIAFACEPIILGIELNATTDSDSQTLNITLTCKVIGDPTPVVDWMTNGSIIGSNSTIDERQYSLSNNTVNKVTWSNFTIFNIEYRNSGDYKCLAKNPVGTDSKIITIVVPAFGIATSDILGKYSAILGKYSGNAPLIIILFTVFLILLVIILIIILCCCYCCRRTTNSSQSNRKYQTGSSDKFEMCLDQAYIMRTPDTIVPTSGVIGETDSYNNRNLFLYDNMFGKTFHAQGEDLESDFEDDDDAEFDSD